MTIQSSSFEDVFAGEANFGPRAIVQWPWDSLVATLHASPVNGEDDLDRFTAVPLKMPEKRFPSLGEVHFALWRHENNPPGTFAIYLPIDIENSEAAIADIVAELEIPASAVIWRDTEQPSLAHSANTTAHSANTTAAARDSSQGRAVSGTVGEWSPSVQEAYTVRSEEKHK
ncbi:MAG: hypothetical protein JOY71_10145 [Acetobacteraceae bacterium]|nr:hypothetical protein [Acetobacteraceae bacterium]